MREVLIRSKEAVTIKDDALYKRVTIKLYGNGCYLRDEVRGEEIGTKKQFIVRKGQFLLSKIDARNGAFGFVSDEMEGAIITGNFWTYNINKEIALPEYLAYLFSTKMFMQFCRDKSFGLTNRKYLNEKEFLEVKIPLPSIEIQQEFINKINARASLIKTLK